MDSFATKSCVTISTDRTLNINLSDIALQNLIDTFKIWSSLKEEKLDKDNFLADIEEYQKKEIAKYSVDNVNFERENRETLEANIKNFEADGDDLAAPVSVVNLTGVSLAIQRIEDNEDENTLIMGGNYREPTKVYQPIRVEFDDGYNPIESIDLSKLHAGQHLLNPANNEIVFYGVHLNRMHKVLTVRTPYVIHNQTIFTYILRVYGEVHEEFKIEPNEKLPITKSMEDLKCSICITSSNEDWSESFNPVEILSLLTAGKEKVFLAHGLSYTFLEKIRDQDVDICYNLTLLPPIILRNCLPFNIDVKVPGSRQEYYILKDEDAYFLSHDLKE